MFTYQKCTDLTGYGVFEKNNYIKNERKKINMKNERKNVYIKNERKKLL